MDKSLEAQLGELLVGGGWTISVAETTTGGLICARIVGTPGSSRYLDRGIVAYSRACKVDMLGVDEDLLHTYGAVSTEAAVALAEGVRRVSETTFGLAETGLAGPIPGRSAKPIGSVCIALAAPGGTRCASFSLEGRRQQIREQIVEKALAFAVKELEAAAFCP